MPTMTFDRDVVNALLGLGFKPQDIDILITTHFDPDHAGMNDAFPGAEIVAQRAGYEEARNGQPRAAITREHWDAPNLRYRRVDGDIALLPGLDLISTPGHAPGHQSVLVRLPNTGAVLLAIDAVAQGSAFRPDREAAPMDLDAAGAIQSTLKLLDVAQREQVALVVHGHDGAQWATLRTAPEFYD
jgi:N-acyl homoserine lactone hydrolase